MQSRLSSAPTGPGHLIGSQNNVTRHGQIGQLGLPNTALCNFAVAHSVGLYFNQERPATWYLIFLPKGFDAGID